MGQTLTNGIFLPNEGERNCYNGLEGNWRAIDGYIGNYNVHVADTVIHVSQEDRNKWDAVTGKADSSALTAHTGDTTIHVTAADKTKWDTVTSKADASALTAHTGNTTIHVTAADKEAWNGKADASALTAHTGDTTIHVTAADKSKWDAVTSKANDADVLHKSGDEAKTGKLTVTELNTTKINNLNPGALSLPNLSAGVDISSYLINIGTTTPSEYTPPANGWIVISISASGPAFIRVYTDGGLDVSSYSERNEIGTTSGGTYTSFTALTIPCIANDKNNIVLSPSSAAVISAKFYPCLGNI